jgi:hypothetical protein
MLLRAGNEWRRRRAAEQQYELAALHSIISSARPDRGSGTVIPSAFAVLRLRKSSGAFFLIIAWACLQARVGRRL